MPIDEIAAAQLGLQALGGLLSLPRAFQAQRLEDMMAREAAVQALGYTPEKAAELYPEPGFLARSLDPGQYQNPIARGVLGTTGDLGNVINSLMGQPIRAPRVDAGAMSQFGVLRQKAAERQENAAIAEQFKNPVAKALARQGNLAKASEVEAGQGIESSTFVNRVQKFLAKGYDMNAAREMALAEEDAVKRSFAQYQGRVNLGVQTGGAQFRHQLKEGEKEGARERGQEFFDQYIAPRVQPPQGRPAPEPMTMPVPSRRGQGYTLISDVTEIPGGQPAAVPGLVMQGATKSSEGPSTMTFGQPVGEEATERGRGRVLSMEEINSLTPIVGAIRFGSTVGDLGDLIVNSKLGPYPSPEYKPLITDTGIKRNAITQNMRLVENKMKLAATALSDDPLYAKFIQPYVLPMTAKGGIPPFYTATPQEMYAAAQVEQLEAFRAYLARMVDVGNLSGTEQDVWNPFLAGKDMTKQELLNAFQAIKSDMGRLAEYYDTILNARSTPELLAALQGKPPLAVPAKEFEIRKQADQAAQLSPTSSQPVPPMSDSRATFENLLNQWSPR